MSANQKSKPLVTTPHSTGKSKRSHLLSPVVAPLIDMVKIIYVGGYFLPDGIDSVLGFDEKVSEKGKAGITSCGNHNSYEKHGSVVKT